MSTNKSPLTSALAILFGLVVLAGGATKLYRGVSNMSSSGANPKIDELLKTSDAAVVEANRKMQSAGTGFQELLGQFDMLGINDFRTQKRDECAKMSEQFASANQQLQQASNSIAEAIKLGANKKVVPFLETRARSYELLVKVNAQNINILQTTLDESMVDMNAIIEKVTSIAQSRDADQKAANEASADADTMLKSL